MCSQTGKEGGLILVTRTCMYMYYVVCGTDFHSLFLPYGSTITSWTRDGEVAAYRNMLEKVWHCGRSQEHVTMVERTII